MFGVSLFAKPGNARLSYHVRRQFHCGMEVRWMTSVLRTLAPGTAVLDHS